MQEIYLPTNIDIKEEEDNLATFEIYPYYPGYGPTVANALRRVMLSSLPGAAITHVQIDGVDHEYSSLEGVKEDMVNVLLNLKRVKVSSDQEEPQEIVLEAKGDGKVVAGDFKTPPGVEISNPKHPIATLTSKTAKFTMRCIVEQGRGYVPSESSASKERPIGTIALDAIYTPVERVSFEVSNVRVGQATNYHKLQLTIKTDGSVAPIDALKQASSILSDHFSELTGDFENKLTAQRPEEEEVVEAVNELSEPDNTLSLLNLPSRVHNALERVGVTTVEQVLELTDEQIQDIPGLGEKAVTDIKAARDKLREEAEGKK